MTEDNARKVYADIIDLPHHQSTARKHMSLYDRAAQFASYKALSGYEDMVIEEARSVDSEIELSENEISIINAVIGEISERTANGDHPTVCVTYFKPDQVPAGVTGDNLKYWNDMMKYEAGNFENYCEKEKMRVIHTPHEHDLMMDDDSLAIIVPEFFRSIGIE